jgi:hypothetical protein
MHRLWQDWCGFGGNIQRIKIAEPWYFQVCNQIKLPQEKQVISSKSNQTGQRGLYAPLCFSYHQICIFILNVSPELSGCCSLGRPTYCRKINPQALFDTRSMESQKIMVFTGLSWNCCKEIHLISCVTKWVLCRKLKLSRSDD